MVGENCPTDKLKDTLEFGQKQKQVVIYDKLGGTAE